MRYFRVKDSFDRADRWYLASPKTRGGADVDPRLFTEGNEYQGECPLEIPVRRGSYALDFTLGAFDMPVVTPGLAKHLQVCCGDSIQIIHARVSGIGNPVAIVNALKLFAAIDEERSEISRWTSDDGIPSRVGTYAGIGKIVIRREIVQGASVFRLKNWESPLIVSEVVKSTLEKMRTTGVLFQELEVV